MNIAMARIIAHLMGDGCLTPRYGRYSNKNHNLLRQFEKDIQKIDSNIKLTKGKTNSNTPFLQFHKRSFIKRLLEYGSCKSGEIEIPSEILRDKKSLKEFIAAIFDDEGSVALRKYKKTGEIKRDVHISLKSKKMIEQLKWVFENRFKIKCNKIRKDVRIRNKRKYVIWELRITGYKNLKRFEESINFRHPQKRKKLRELIRSYKFPPLRES